MLSGEEIMKSNEEFIAGIYEKAAVYTQEQQNRIKKVNTSSRAIKMVATIAVCVGLASVGNFVWNQSRGNTQEHGISLLSETDGESVEPGVAFHRIGPVQDYAVFTGTVESIEEQEKVIWLTLEFTQEVQDDTLVAVRFDILEEISKDICVGRKLMVSGVLGTYEKGDSKRVGLTQLTVNDLTNVWLWIEETGKYQNKDGEEPPL